MPYGKIEYNEDGQPKCEICGEYFNRVISHVRQKHEMNEKEYKKQFGFDLKKGICSKESAERTRLKTLDNYDKCIQRNLIIKGSETRFNDGDNGRTKEQVSEQTRIRLKERLKEPYMVDAMKKAGELVGKSGLGNKKKDGHLKNKNMQTNYENALSFIESYGWDDEKLRKADGIIPLVATMLELYSKGKELNPTDIKEEKKQEIEKYCDLVLSLSMDFKCGRVEHSHYINTLLSISTQLKKVNW